MSNIQSALDDLINELPDFWRNYAKNIKNSIQPIISFSLTETKPKLWDSKIGGTPPPIYPKIILTHKTVKALKCNCLPNLILHKCQN